MLASDKRLDSFAREILTKIRSRKTQQAQMECIRDLLFNIPIMHSVKFPPELTTRELQCLYYAAYGATINETAKKTDIQPSTVIAHRKEAMRKMGCRNVTEAVFKLFSYGVLQPMKD